jgi:hypothetical protein
MAKKEPKKNKKTLAAKKRKSNFRPKKPLRRKKRERDWS